MRKTAVTLILLALCAAGGANAQVVISQVYGGGGSTATSPLPSYKYDFIELYNNGSSAVDLSAFSLQYFSATGTAGIVHVLTGSIGAGQYYLAREGAPAANVTGADIPLYDSAGGLNLSATNGKVALVNGTTSVTLGTAPGGGQSRPIPSSVVDFVGYGTADTWEGTAAVGALSTTTAALRNPGTGPYGDSNNNNTDFTIVSNPVYRTSPSPVPAPSALVSCLLGAPGAALYFRRRKTA